MASGAFVGRRDELEVLEDPLTAATEALRGLVDAMGVDVVRRAAGSSSRVLRRVLPALGPALADEPGGALAQSQLFEAVLDLLGRVAAEEVAVAALDAAPPDLPVRAPP